MVDQLTDPEFAQLHVISYSGILTEDKQTLANLWSAATNNGFFYLDLNETSCVQVLSDVAKLMMSSDNMFGLPLEEKMKYDTNKLGSLKNYGYKPVGRNTGVAEGQKDGHELFLIPHDVINGTEPDGVRLSCPPILKEDTPLLKSFANGSYDICSVVLGGLAMLLEQPCLTSQHRSTKPSTSTLALLKYPPTAPTSDLAGHIAHTDVGSLTLLFCHTMGLQVLHPILDRWMYVKPLDGYAVVNIGDSLRHMSQRRLKSCLHRVVPFPGKEYENRTSVIYFLRPEKEARFFDKSGKEWKGVEWHVRKFHAFQNANAQAVESILTDGF